MMVVWIKRLTTLGITIALMGCAAPAPKEPIRLAELPKVNAEIVRLNDARLADAQTGEKVQMPSGQGSRIPTSIISPEPFQVIKAFVNEFLEEKSVKPLTETFAVTRIDLAVLRGKAAPVGNAPGAEGYLGYAGAALGKLMVQAIQDAAAANIVEAVVTLKSEQTELQCAGRSSIEKDQTAEATLLALRNAAQHCGWQLRP